MLPTKRRTSSSVFLPGNVFVVFPARVGRAKKTRRIDLRQPWSYYFFHALSRKGDRATGTTAQRRRGVRVDDSPPPFFVFTSVGSFSSSFLLLLLFASSSLRDLIRCRKSGDADTEEAQFTQLARRGYLIICWLSNDETPRDNVASLLLSFSINFYYSREESREIVIILARIRGKKFFAAHTCDVGSTSLCKAA